MGGKASYDFEQKNNWRRWWANQYADRLGRSRSALRGASLLWLCGPEGSDGDALCERGFSPQNLWAFDIDAENTSRMKDRGYKTITGDLCTGLISWMPDIPLHGIAADMCHPLNLSAWDLLMAITLSPACRLGFVVGVNMMRGRDAVTNSFRNKTAASMASGKAVGVIAAQNGMTRADVLLHRGVYLYFNAMSKAVSVTEDMGWSVDKTAWDGLIGNPRFYSYKSGNFEMDSVVFTWPCPTPIDKGHGAEQLPKDTVDMWIKRRSARTIHGKKLKLTRRKIAAMRAVTRMQHGR